MRLLTAIGLAAMLVLASGCVTRQGGGRAGLDEIRIVFTDFELQQNQVSRAQPIITVTPTLELTNPNNIAVKLEKLELQVRGPEELVQLDQRTWPVGKEIGPGARLQHRVNIFATIQTRGNRNVQLSPLYVSGRAYFSSAQGSFSQGFVQQQQDMGDYEDDGDDGEDAED